MNKPIEYESRLTVRLSQLEKLDDVLTDWSSLCGHRTSIFLSETWIFPCLTIIKSDSEVFILRFYANHDLLVGICFITKADIKRRGVFRIRQFSLNEAETNGNKFIIEYNNILHNPTYRDDVYFSFVDFIANVNIKFDELRINATPSSLAMILDMLCSKHRLKYIETEASRAYYTDLTVFQLDPDKYLASLSRNKREQIRRSIKYYSKLGMPEIQYASSPHERIRFFHALGELHQKYWIARGKPGSFSNEKWIDFHVRIITEHPENVQLIRVSFGDHVLGYLYNLIDQNTAYSIQSGFNYSENNNDRPGIIAHFMVTNDYIKDSFVRYEYLAGESQYKQSLSNEQNEFSWCLIQKRSMKLGIENALLLLKRNLESIENVIRRR